MSATSPTATAAELHAFQLLKLSRDLVSLKLKPGMPADAREAMIANLGFSLALETLIVALGPSPITLAALAKMIVKLGRMSQPPMEHADIFDLGVEHLSAALEESVRAEARALKAAELKANGLPGVPKAKP